LRDKQMTMLGGSLVSIFIVYQCLWSPYTSYVQDMRSRINKNQTLLEWMLAADNVIQKKERKSVPQNKLTSPIILLGFLQKQIAHAGLEQNLVQLKQASNETIEMHFQKVDFDKLIRMLIVILREENVSITQLSALAEGAPGIVNSDIILKLAPVALSN